MAGVITASEPSWIAPFAGLSPRRFGKSVTTVRREGVADGHRGRPWSLPLEDRILLVVVYWRTNLTMRQIAPLPGVSESAADRIIDHLGPLLALQPRKRFRKDTVLIVDGTLAPTRDHTIAEQSKNYRYSTAHQVVIDADTRLVVVIGRPLAGNRHDSRGREESGAKAAAGKTMTIADGGYQGTGLVSPHRRRKGDGVHHAILGTARLHNLTSPDRPTGGTAADLALTRSKITYGTSLSHGRPGPFNKIVLRALRTFKAFLLRRVEASTPEVIWGHLSSILSSAVDDKRLLRNPVKAHQSVKRPRPPEKKAKAWTRVIADAVRSHLQERYQFPVDLGLGLGLRQGEAFGLAEEDFDLEAGVAHVRRQLRWDVKGRPYFCLPRGQDPRGPHSAKSGSPRQKVTRYSSEVRRHPVFEASRSDMFHALRHAYAGVQLEAGESIVSLSKWLGHSSPKITLDHYLHFMPGAGSRGLAAMDAWLEQDRQR
ncbi:Transposase DDE domain-containing protein [Streptomyces sp. TLI_105]|nr:Transposase DDE domain-containing protein [Streptomyces sp. TLI_105]